MDDWSDETFLCLDVNFEWDAVARIEFQISAQSNIYFEGELRPRGSRTRMRFFVPSSYN